MPTATPAGPKGGGKPKHGPFTTVGWLGVVGGVVLGYVLLKRYEADKAATNAAANTAIAPQTLEPDNIGSDTGSASNAATSGSNYSSMQSWVSAMITAMSSGGANPNYGNAEAFNDVTSWINGSCVTAAGYSAISSAIGSVGLPPGYDPGPLSVCPSAASTPAPTTTTPTVSAAPATTPWGSVVGSADAALAALNPASFAQQINYGQYSLTPGGAGTNMTQVGTIENGAYQGSDILNGAPAYVGAFGAMVQNFNPKQFANGTAVYVPTELVNQGYVKGVGSYAGA